MLTLGKHYFDQDDVLFVVTEINGDKVKIFRRPPNEPITEITLAEAEAMKTAGNKRTWQRGDEQRTIISVIEPGTAIKNDENPETVVHYPDGEIQYVNFAGGPLRAVTQTEWQDWIDHVR